MNIFRNAKGANPGKLALDFSCRALLTPCGSCAQVSPARCPSTLEAAKLAAVAAAVPKREAFVCALRNFDIVSVPAWKVAGKLAVAGRRKTDFRARPCA